MYFSIHQYTFPYTLCIRVHYISLYMPFHAVFIHIWCFIDQRKSFAVITVWPISLLTGIPLCRAISTTFASRESGDNRYCSRLDYQPLFSGNEPALIPHGNRAQHYTCANLVPRVFHLTTHLGECAPQGMVR